MSAKLVSIQIYGRIPIYTVELNRDTLPLPIGWSVKGFAIPADATREEAFA